MKTDSLEKAHWIWLDGDPRPRNLHVLFRRELEIKSHTIKKTVAKVSADTTYILYVNGNEISRGPARCESGVKQYDEIDISRFVLKGKNCLAAIVHHYGESTFSQFALRGAFYFDLRFGAKQIVSDHCWKCLPASAWARNLTRMSIQVGFPEVFDARIFPEGWKYAGFDESGWQSVCEIPEIGIPWRLKHRDVPLLKLTENFSTQLVKSHEISYCSSDLKQPGKIAETILKEELKPLTRIALSYEPGGRIKITGLSSTRGVSLTFDFEHTVSGYPEIRITCKTGTTVDLGYSEALIKGRVDPCVLTAYEPGRGFADRFFAKAGENLFRLREPRAFRYLQVDIKNTDNQVFLNKVGIIECRYPFKDVAEFSCSHSLIEKTWNISANTVKLCSEDLFMDCPTRERAQWTGDAYLEALTSYIAFGNSAIAITRKALLQAALAQTQDGLIPALAPSYYHNRMPAYGLYWILSAWNHLRYTGDVKSIKIIYPAMVRQVEYFLSRRVFRGLVNLDPPYGCDICTFDGSSTAPGSGTAINALFCAALDAAVELAKEMNDLTLAEKFRTEASNLRTAINQVLWDKKRGLYLDWISTNGRNGDPSEFANVMAVLYAPPASTSVQKILHKTLAKEFSGQRIWNPFAGYFHLLALEAAGMTHDALEHIEKMWGPDVSRGNETCREHWDTSAWPNVEITSLCHGWGSGPLPFLAEQIAGIVPRESGFRRLELRPNFRAFERLHCVVPSPKGNVEIEWNKKKEKIDFGFLIPPNVVADFSPKIPDFEKIELRKIGSNQRLKTFLNLSPGKYEGRLLISR